MVTRLAICLVLAAVWSPAQTALRESLSIRLIPPQIEVGPFWGGSKVRVEGSVAAGAKVAVVVRGRGRQETFNRKSRVGPIWVNTGKVHVSAVPSLFLRFTSGPIRTFLNREGIDQHQLDEAAIRRQMRIEPNQDHDLVLSNWITLKSREGTYGLVRDGVRMGTPADERVPFWVEFDWPKKAPPGRYLVSAYECRDGGVTRSVVVELPVVTVGFPAWLSGIATERAALYGIFAVLAAAVAGFGIDLLTMLIFGKKRARSH